jgi:hypothetical protein
VELKVGGCLAGTSATTSAWGRKTFIPTCCEQVAYHGGLVTVHGQGNGPPAGGLDLNEQEQLLGMFGKAGPSGVSQLGFNSSYGTSYGPWGGGISGSPFASTGRVVAFFGAMKAGPQDCLGALGVWMSNLPAISPPPPPPPRPPPARGMSQSRLFGGDLGFEYSDWDDGPSYPGGTSHVRAPMVWMLSTIAHPCSCFFTRHVIYH